MFLTCERKVVKQISEIFPHVGIPVLTKTSATNKQLETTSQDSDNLLVIESVDLSDLTALVVAPEDGDPAAESHLQ